MVGIVSNSAALFAQRNLAVAASSSESSISRLSSGNAIVSAADDVAGLAIGTVLRTTVSTLKTILNSAAQATSLLGIADAGLQNIGEILQRQKSLAVQANTGSLSDNERAFLDQEFQNLVSEINRIVDNTKFNGIALLNGSISGAAGLTTATGATSETYSLNASTDYSVATDGTSTYGTPTMLHATPGTALSFDVAVDGGTRESAVFTFGANASAGTANNSVTTFSTAGVDTETFIVQGITFTFAATGQDLAARDIENGASATATAANLAAAINYYQDNTGFAVAMTASNVGGVLTLRADAVVGAQSALAVTGTTISNATAVLPGGTVHTAGVAADTIDINGNTFTFVASTELTTGLNIAVGSTLADTLDNIVQHLNDGGTGGGGAEDNGVGKFVNAFTYSTNGSTTLTATANVAAATNVAGDWTSSSGTVSEVYTAGVAAAAVTTPTYQATLQGAITNVNATFYAADSNNNARVQLSAEVGGVTYLSQLLDLGSTPAITGSEEFVFTSQADTGSTDVTFTLTLAAGADQVVTSQANANTLANSIQADLDGLGYVINQQRAISSFDEAATDGTVLHGLAAADVTIVAEAFDTAGGFGSMGAFTVDRENNRITLTIDDEVYTADLVAYEAQAAGSYNSSTKVITTDGILFFNSASETDGRSVQVDLTNVASATITIDSDEGEAALESILNGAFAIGGSAALNFQVGTTAADSIGLSLNSASTTNIYVNDDGEAVDLSVATAEGAIAASDVLDNAINTVTSLRATVGALQSRFNFASSNVNASIQNTEAARAIFLDVDIASESTKFATAQVRLQASISVLAQANLIPQNLLKLIG